MPDDNHDDIDMKPEDMQILDVPRDSPLHDLLSLITQPDDDELTVPDDITGPGSATN